MIKHFYLVFVSIVQAPDFTDRQHYLHEGHFKGYANQ